jgi:hypothetical protein
MPLPTSRRIAGKFPDMTQGQNPLRKIKMERRPRRRETKKWIEVGKASQLQRAARRKRLERRPEERIEKEKSLKKVEGGRRAMRHETMCSHQQTVG